MDQDIITLVGKQAILLYRQGNALESAGKQLNELRERVATLEKQDEEPETDDR